MPWTPCALPGFFYTAGTRADGKHQQRVRRQASHGQASRHPRPRPLARTATGGRAEAWLPLRRAGLVGRAHGRGGGGRGCTDAHDYSWERGAWQRQGWYTATPTYILWTQSTVHTQAAQGCGSRMVARGLRADGWPSQQCSTAWDSSGGSRETAGERVAAEGATGPPNRQTARQTPPTTRTPSRSRASRASRTGGSGCVGCRFVPAASPSVHSASALPTVIRCTAHMRVQSLPACPRIIHASAPAGTANRAR